jgi:alanine racemase
MAVVKANAYGHGALMVAPVVAEHADWLGVDSIGEAMELDAARLRRPLLILGHTEADRLELVVRRRFRQVLYRRDTAAALAEHAVALGGPAYVHLKVETGLHRLGVPLEKLPSFARFVAGLEGLVVEGVYTHFADVEDPASSFYRDQLERLREALDVLRASGLDPTFVHASPTAGALVHEPNPLTLARVGIGLYGVWPSPEIRAAASPMELKPVLSWKARIVQVKTVPPGASVGYERTYRASSERRIAVIPVGYYDGFDRKLSGRGEVLVRGRRAPVVGRVAMNMTMIDVTDSGGVEDDEVVLIGEQGSETITADDVAGWSDTIAYEVLARLSREIPRSMR